MSDEAQDNTFKGKRQKANNVATVMTWNPNPEYDDVARLQRGTSQ